MKVKRIQCRISEVILHQGATVVTTKRSRSSCGSRGSSSECLLSDAVFDVKDR